MSSSSSQHHHRDPKELEEEEEIFPPIHRDSYINYSNVVIVDNTPKVGRDKEEKLLSVLKRIFGQFGTVESVIMPYEKNGSKTCGFAFFEYTNSGEARSAVEKLNNYKLDKSHVFKTNLFEDFEICDKLPQEYKSNAEDQVYQPQENLYDWLNEPYGSDQFVLRYADVAEIQWNGTSGNPPRSIITVPTPRDNFVQWSPKGTYLVAFHQLGVILWGGPSWKKIRKMPHSGVESVEFSPNENYLVTFSRQFLESDRLNQEKGDKSEPQSIIIWDVKVGQPLRGFAYGGIWPAFQWSHDDKFFSRISKGLVSVYETPKMVLLESNNSTSIKFDAMVKDHAWSPTDNILCSYIPEVGNVPARVLLMDIPSLRIISEKALFKVISCVILWQDKGDFLAVKVDRAKSKKKCFTAFEFFRMREKNIPVEDLKLDDTVVAFSWEPRGQRFAIIHAPENTENRIKTVSFYTMDGSKVKLIHSLPNRTVNHLLWSPRGRFIVLFSNNGVFEFYDVNIQETMAKEKQHLMATFVTWDPTGRYVTTYVSAWKAKTEHGYKIWSFRGTELLSIFKDGFAQFAWRPRPPTLLTDEQLRQLDDPSFFKQFAQKYKAEDRVKADESKLGVVRQKEKLRSDYRKFMGRKKMEYENDRAWRESVGIEEDEGYLVEEMVQEVVEQTEEVVTD